MSSDFFLEEADEWRKEAWDMIKVRSDVKFFLLTKRPERIEHCLPEDWGDGYDNVILNVTCENQRRVDERIPILLQLPAKHKGVMCAPFIGAISIEKYLASGQIEQVICGGENYDGARLCHFEWVKKLREECVKFNITFCFIETGTVFVKDEKRYYIPKKQIQSELAFKSGMSYKGKKIEWKLKDCFGEIPQENLYIPNYKEHCHFCGSKLICNGCSDCGKCKK